LWCEAPLSLHWEKEVDQLLVALAELVVQELVELEELVATIRQSGGRWWTLAAGAGKGNAPSAWRNISGRARLGDLGEQR